MSDKKQWVLEGSVRVVSSPLETKGWVTFLSRGLGRSKSLSKKLDGVCTQDLIEDLYVKAVMEFFGLDAVLRMHPDDYKAYCDSNRVVVVV